MTLRWNKYDTPNRGNTPKGKPFGAVANNMIHGGGSMVNLHESSKNLYGQIRDDQALDFSNNYGQHENQQYNDNRYDGNPYYYDDQNPNLRQDISSSNSSDANNKNFLGGLGS
jgi:hypothetical protein